MGAPLTPNMPLPPPLRNSVAKAKRDGFLAAMALATAHRRKPRRGRPRKYGDTLLTMKPEPSTGPVGRRVEWTTERKATLVLVVFDETVGQPRPNYNEAIIHLYNRFSRRRSPEATRKPRSPATLRRVFHAALRDPQVRELVLAYRPEAAGIFE